MSAAPGITSRLAALLRIEDVLMGAFAFAGLPLLDRLRSSPASRPSGADTPDALTGWFALIGILGVLACLCTRGPDEPPPLSDGTLTLQGWARFPLAAGIGIVGIETLPGIGLDGDPFVGIAFLIVLVTVLIPSRLPVVPVAARRALVTPMAIVATGAFDQIMGSGLGDLVGGYVRGQAPPELAAFAPIIIGAAAVMYVMLVVAPRAIADPGASWLAWTARFVLLLAALAAGTVVFGPAA
jgi:hypothetical protein